MGFNNFINKIADLGVKKNYQPWEIHLVRKQNLVTLLGAFNLVVATFIFILIDYPDMVLQVFGCIIISPFVLLTNYRFGYVAASYVFAFVGYVVFFLLSVRLGEESLSFLYYFPLIIGMTQMLGRRETIKHLIIQLCLCFISIFLAAYCYRNGFLQSENFGKSISQIRVINIIFSFFTAMVFVIIISIESIKQEGQLKVAIRQKEILLAELFHRVKNNLNLVTSLLNLKKNTITSKEAQDAIEECRNMVYSMALVHNKIYNSNNIDSLDLKKYLEVLSLELINSFGGKDNLEVEVISEPINLTLTQAIPCGLIINEFITNSFKHARVSGRKLKITLMLTERQGEVSVSLSDNGPGNMTIQQEKSSLGLDLIKSLTEQLDGESHFLNKNGLHFNLKFKK